jgi:small-conductance mechanosensitive channel
MTVRRIQRAGVRLRHRTLDHVEVPSLGRAMAAAVTPDFRAALAAGVVAIGGLIVAGVLGDRLHGTHRHPTTLHGQLFTLGGALGFMVFAVIAIRSAASEVHRVLEPRTGPSHAGVVRWAVTLAGYAIVAVTALGILKVPVGHLLLGGALTGVIIGIAAQQALGNVFAGVVLLLARPFNVGDSIRIRAGSLSGELTGVVAGMGMTYVTLQTADGPLSIPNSGVLSAVIGPLPPAEEPREEQNLPEDGAQSPVSVSSGSAVSSVSSVP